jgi:hypothetical protein
MKRIFIIGCGRSGTTLMQRLMHCSVDTFVAPLEHPVSKFDEIADYPVAVVKRTATCHRTLWSLPPDNIVSLLCMVRHPFDVLTSRMHYDDDHFHIEPKRWSREFHALEALEQSLPRPHIVFVRYETLVQCPDSVQADIARSYGLEIYRLFSTSATISLGSVRKWERDPGLLDYLDAIKPRLVGLERFCSRFDYDLPELSRETPSRLGSAPIRGQ